MLTIDSFTRTKISEFNLVARNQDILRFDIPMENPFFMDKGQSFEKAVHIELNLHVVKVSIIYQALV